MSNVRPSSILTVQQYGYGAVFDGNSHTLRSVGYTSLAAAQVDFPFATNIDTNEIDRCAVQKAVNLGPNATGGIVGDAIYLPQGTGVFDWPVQIPASRIVNIRGAGKWATYLSYNTNAGRSFVSGPFFVVYPLSYSRPTFVTGAPGGSRGIKFVAHDALPTPTSYLNLSDYSGCDLGTQTKVTMQADVRIDVLPAGPNSLETIFGCGGGLSTNQFSTTLYYLGLYTDGGSGHLTALISCHANGSNFIGTADLNGIVGLGEWHNFKVIRTGTTLKLFLDGSGTATITVTGCPNPIVQQWWEHHCLGQVPSQWPDSIPSSHAFNGAIANPQLLDQNDAVVIAPDFSAASNPNDPVETSLAGIVIPAPVPSFGGGGFSCLLTFRDVSYRGDTSFSLSGIGFQDGTFGVFTHGSHNGRFTDWSAVGTRFPMYLYIYSFQNIVDDFNASFASGAVVCGDNASGCEVRNGQASGCTVALASQNAVSIFSNHFIFNCIVAPVIVMGGSISINEVNTTDESTSVQTGYGFMIFDTFRCDIQNSSVSLGEFPKVPILLSGISQGRIEMTQLSVHPDVDYRMKFVDASTGPRPPTFRIPVMPNVNDGQSVPLTNQTGWIVDERVAI